jgi:hypothetical protein
VEHGGATGLDDGCSIGTGDPEGGDTQVDDGGGASTAAAGQPGHQDQDHGIYVEGAEEDEQARRRAPAVCM